MKTELRIGNIVWHVLLAESMVAEIRRDGITLCSPTNPDHIEFVTDDKLNRIEPFPITDKKLIDLGFKEVRPRAGVAQAFVRNGVRVNKSNSGNFYHNQRHLYLHDLQNLFYALKKRDI